MPSLARWCRSLYFSYLSKPPEFRVIYRSIRKYRLGRILEIGMGDGRRSLRMIEAAASRGGGVFFAGIDLFELRGPADGRVVPLKAAHQRLIRTPARVRLIPGDPLEALARTANSLGEFDLVVVSAPTEAASMARAWFYLPRLLHEKSQVWEEVPSQGGKPVRLERVSAAEIAARARVGRRRAA